MNDNELIMADPLRRLVSPQLYPVLYCMLTLSVTNKFCFPLQAEVYRIDDLVIVVKLYDHIYLEVRETFYFSE